MPDDPHQFFHPATGCARCPALVPGRHHVVWGKGPTPAEIMAIGEAPGYNEDMDGRPFVGNAGRLLDRMLIDAGFRPADIHIGNVLMCRPPENRDPEPPEIENCAPWLIEHIRDVQPRALILFGRYSIGTLFDRSTVAETQGLMHQRLCLSCGVRGALEHLPRRAEAGHWRDVSEPCPPKTELLVAAIYHPASALGGRSPQNQSAIVHQLKRLKNQLEGEPDA